MPIDMATKPTAATQKKAKLAEVSPGLRKATSCRICPAGWGMVGGLRGGPAAATESRQAMSADAAIKSGAAERMSCLVKGLCGIGPVGLGAFGNRSAVRGGIVCRERFDEAGMNLLQILCSLAQLLFSFLSGIAYNLSLRTVNRRSGVAHCVWLTAKGREHSARLWGLN